MVFRYFKSLQMPFNIICFDRVFSALGRIGSVKFEASTNKWIHDPHLTLLTFHRDGFNFLNLTLPHELFRKCSFVLFISYRSIGS